MPDTIYYGREIWEQAVSALLCGKNLLLVGHKATGKNIFAENLAGVFQRPKWDISFHVATDAASLIGMDTFKNGEVQFRPGPIYNAAKYGYIDDVIEPRNTRFRVIRALQQLQTKKLSNPAKKHGNIPL